VQNTLLITLKVMRCGGQ